MYLRYTMFKTDGEKVLSSHGIGLSNCFIYHAAEYSTKRFKILHLLTVTLRDYQSVIRSNTTTNDTATKHVLSILHLKI
nr:hypothetical protein GPGIFMOB_00324 [Acinetobacter gerneri]